MKNTFTSGFSNYNNKHQDTSYKIEIQHTLQQLETIDPVSLPGPSIQLTLPAEHVVLKPLNLPDENKKKKKKIQPQLSKREEDDYEIHPLLQNALQSSSYKLNLRMQNLMESKNWLGNYFTDNKA